MISKTSYNSTEVLVDNDIIPIKIITLQTRIINQLKKHNWIGDLTLFKVNNNGIVGELMRMDDMLNAMREGRKLPPVVIKKIELYTPPHIKVPKYSYNICDGAHRIAASLLMGYDMIPIIYL